MAATTHRPIGRGFKSSSRLPFDKQIMGYVEKYKLQLKMFIPMFAEEMAEELVYNTPLRTGLLRGSWKVGFHSNIRRDGFRDPGGLTVIGMMQRKLKTWSGQPIYFVNTAVYSMWVERGSQGRVGRYYIQRSLSAAPAIAERVARRVKATVK